MKIIWKQNILTQWSTDSLYCTTTFKKLWHVMDFIYYTSFLHFNGKGNSSRDPNDAIVYTPSPSFLLVVGVGVQPPTKFSKGGLDRISIFRRGLTFFRGGCSFYIKNKLKFEIFNDKKVCKQKCFCLS